MKILTVGVFSHKGSTNIQSAKQFEKLGHRVIYFEIGKKTHTSDEEYHLRTTNTSNINKKSFKSYFKIFFLRITTILYEKNLPFRRMKCFLFGNWRKSRQLVNEVKKNKYDLVFLNKISNIHYRYISKLNKYAKTWFFYMDPLASALKMGAEKYAKRSTWSSATFSTVNSLFKKAGAKSYHIMEGVNMELFKPSEKPVDKTIDVIFVGLIDENRKKYIDYILSKNISVKCYGIGWQTRPLNIPELIKKYHKSKIVLNLTRDKTGFSDRIVLATATKSFVLSQYCRDLEFFFKKAFHLDWFKTPEECVNLINHYLENDSLREEIVNNGYQYISDNFTWVKIIEKILKITGL